MKTASWRGSALSIVCALALVACGGGSDGNPNNTVTPSNTDTTSGSGTGSGGSTSNNGTQVTAAAGGTVTFPTSSAVTVMVSGSTAQVSLPANALVLYDTPAQAASGSVSVAVTPINPALNPTAMGGGTGSYVARTADGSSTQLIESFGALSVDLSQNGKRLQLAAGQTATIRIPLSTRSTERPATMPLYYWDESKLIWVQEGTATLKGDASSGYYYEGQVSHFSTWNADKPIEQSVRIKGCVQSSQGVAAKADTFLVSSEGLDYSGIAWATNTDGGFTVLAKKGGSVKLNVKQGGNLQTRELGVVDTDRDITDACFVLDDSSATTSTAEAFLDLVSSVAMRPLSLVMSTANVVDSESMTVLPANQVCTSGTAAGIVLDGNKNTQGGDPISSGARHTLAASFNGCTPVNEADSDPLPMYSGYTVAAFQYTLDANSGQLTLQADNVLTNLQDESIQLLAQGSYHVDLTATNSILTQTLTPAKGATLTNRASQATLTYLGGSFQTSTNVNNVDELVNATLTVTKLSYQLKGVTYVLDGSLANGQGTLTLTKNGAVSATLTIVMKNGIPSYTVTGLVDPF